VHDYNGGVQPSGLFWLVPLHRDAFSVSRDGRRATLEVRHESVIDSFQFGGPTMVPAAVSFSITWEAVGDRRRRGEGSDVPPTDPAAFLGRFARARSTASFRGSALGFSFRSDTATTDRGYALMGPERNGVFLGSDAGSA
jgi:hypothetical protein